MILGKKNRLGNAVLLVILLIPVLVFLARAVAWLSSTGHFRTLSHRQGIAGTYIMEAGLAHASTMIIEDATWEDGFDQEKMTRTNGNYTITFQPANSGYQEGNSVNNIFGTDVRDGPRGPETVVPGTAELVVHSQAGNSESSGVFLMQAIFDGNNNWAVSSAGHIHMQGDVKVSGVQNAVEFINVNAGIHANIYQAQEAAISWVPKRTGDQANFTGKVSTPSRGDRAIEFAGTEGADYSAEEFETGVGRLAIPVPDILGTISSNSSASFYSPPALGESTIGGGDYYHNGQVDLQGDLILNGANLYVQGNLNVNGTIRGTGSVWVAGKTAFKGDAWIESGQDGIALYSEGSITLAGFNGREFMKRVSANNPSILSQFDNAIGQIYAASDRTPDGVQGDHIESARSSLRHVRSAVDRALDGSNGETVDFVKEQLSTFDEIAHSNADGDNSWGRYEMGIAHRKLAFGLDRIGTAYFKGLMVTNSYINTESASAVVGAVWATGANENDASVTINGEEVKPGDVYLGDDTSILLNKDLVNDDETASPTRLKGLDMLTWQR